jgi:hypothetical protein
MILAAVMGSALILPVDKDVFAAELPANEWVSTSGLSGDVKDRIQGLEQRWEMITGAPRKVRSGWRIKAKSGTQSCVPMAAWIPERKQAFFILTSGVWTYDPARAARNGNAKYPGWSRLAPKGKGFRGHLNWATICYDPINKEVFLAGGNTADPDGSPGTMVFRISDNTWKKLSFSDMPMHAAYRACHGLWWDVHGFVGTVRNRWHVAESTEEAGVDLGAPASGFAEKVSALIATMTGAATGEQEKKQAKWAGPQLAAAKSLLEKLSKDLGKTVTPALIVELTKAAEHLRIARDFLAVEPPPRGNAGLAFDEKNGVMVLYGGDRFDYLMGDTWL